jgi:flagellar biosynthesis protein FlhF
MRLRSFHGNNMTDAMRQVREALGDHAIIVATRDDDMGGVRVTAAVDDVAAKANGIANHAPVQVAEIDNDLIEGMADIFHKHGVGAVLAEKILATAMNYAANDMTLALAAGIDAHLQFRPLVEGKVTRPMVLVGPPGAGKTLSTAKLATAAKMRQQAVSVITTDIDRAGGIDQLAAFTKILKIKLLEIEDVGALRDTLSTQAPGQLIIVDTSGRNPFKNSDRDELKALLAHGNVEAMLVMPAGYETQEGTDLASAFRELGATSMMMTRVDMTRRLGSMITISHDAKLPLAGLSRSNNVTEALETLNPVSTARLLLNEKKNHAAVPAAKPTGTHA